MMLIPAVSCFKSYYMETHAYGREDSVIIIKDKSKFEYALKQTVNLF